MARNTVDAGALRDLVVRLTAPLPPQPPRPPGRPVAVDRAILGLLAEVVPADVVLFSDSAAGDARLRTSPYDRELMVPLPSPPGHVRLLRFLRLAGLDFDETDRCVATLIRPHLVAHLHALDLQGRGLPPLTARQRQLLSFLAEGCTNTQIAHRLGISPQTVRTHLQQIYAKLGVTSRGEAVALMHPAALPAPVRSGRRLGAAPRCRSSSS